MFIYFLTYSVYIFFNKYNIGEDIVYFFLIFIKIECNMHIKYLWGNFTS